MNELTSRARRTDGARRIPSLRRTVLVERLEQRQLLDSGAARETVADLSAVSAPSSFPSLEAYKSDLIDRAVANWQYVLGTSLPAGDSGMTLATGSQTGPLPAAIVPAPKLSSFSAQVDGVGEGDIVQTDGKSLYVLTGKDLVVVDARQPSALKVLFRKTFDSTPAAEYLAGNHLTVITRGDALAIAFDGLHAPLAGVPAGVTVSEFDVSDPSAPRETRTTNLDGTYIDSRSVGDRVYLVLQSGWSVGLPAPASVLTDGKWVYETVEAYRARLQAIDASTLVPHYSATATAQDGTSRSVSGPLLTGSSISKPATPAEGALLAVVTFNSGSSDPGPAGSIGVVATPGATVYATPTHLDLLGSEWPMVTTQGLARSSTVIRRFDLNGDVVTPSSNGVVPGTILNRFAVDDTGDVLRIVTTDDPSGPVGRGGSIDLRVLKAQAGILQTVGSLGDISHGERVRSVRFVGDRAFIDTFLNVDPLIALDLGDPTAPVSAGALKTTGYVSYLLPIDANHLIGIGRSADLAGRITGLEISLFDVTDLSRPKQVDTAVIPTSGFAWVQSDAEFDPHAVSYFAESGTLAIPVLSTEPWALPIARLGGSVDGPPLGVESGLYVFKVDPATGLTSLGSVSEASAVRRSLTIGDTLFTVSDGEVKTTPVGDPAKTLGTVTINPNPPSGWIAPPIWHPIFKPIDDPVPAPPIVQPDPASPDKAPASPPAEPPEVQPALFDPARLQQIIGGLSGPVSQPAGAGAVSEVKTTHGKVTKHATPKGPRTAPQHPRPGHVSGTTHPVHGRKG